MGITGTPFQLSPQDRTFPAPSNSSQTVDWLPEYLGFSWLAYGSRSNVVISIAPVPTRQEEAELGPFLRQIIDISEVNAEIACVRWAPKGPSVGLLAAACGDCVYVHGPEGFCRNKAADATDLPQGWILMYRLEHSFQVLSFAWTESGDGFLAVGREVAMWKQCESGWCHLWTSHVADPQFLAAATWSAKGLAATADGNPISLTGNSYSQAHQGKSVRGKATVWWWEDSLGLLETELVHPQQVLMLQWRPSKGLDVLQEPYRPVLLTTSKDGAVRLWLEIDSGRARLDKALGKDVAEKHLKPAYFVSAVIEAEQCLHGILGKDVFVTWALDLIDSSSTKVHLGDSSNVSSISKRESVGSCEWLLGIGPNGSISLWSVFCLDDIYPPRCPRVFLWKQASALIPKPPASAKNGTGSILIKAVAQRLGDKSVDPPSSLDVLCIIKNSLFQWLRIWPPVNAMGGGGSKGAYLPEFGSSKGAYLPEFGSSKLSSSVVATSQGNAWGVATASLFTNGHSCNIISVAVHPIASTGLVASLDMEGGVFLWYCSTFSYLAGKPSGLCVPILKPCGHLADSLEFKMLTWLPAVFSEDRTALLLAHAGIVNCFLVANQCGKKCDASNFIFNSLFRLDLRLHSFGQELQGIWVFPTQIDHGSDLQSNGFVVIGLGQGGHELISLSLEIIYDEAHSGVKSQMLADQNDDARDESTGFTVNHNPKQGNSSENNISIRTSLMGIMTVGDLECILCIAVVPSCFLSYMDKNTNCLMFEPVTSARPYDFATGSADGMLKLWKAVNRRKNNSIHCMGILKVYSGPLNCLALGSCGLKIATVGSDIPGNGKSILIWDVESYLDSGAFILCSRTPLTLLPASIEWLNIGNGQSILGCLTGSDVHIYVEVRVSNRDLETIVSLDAQSSMLSQWALLASTSLKSGASCLKWGPKGSLIIAFKDHIIVYAQRIFREEEKRDFYQAKPSLALADSSLQRHGSRAKSFSTIVEAADFLNSSLPSYHPVKILYHLFAGNHWRARVCLLHLQEGMTQRFMEMENENFFGLHWNHPMQLTDIFQLEFVKAATTKALGSKQSRPMDWGTSSFQEYDDTSALLGKMTLSEEASGVSAHGEADGLVTLDGEKLEISIEKFRCTLGLSEDQKIQLLAAADLLGKMNSISKGSEYASLDVPGQRFWLSVHLLFYEQSRKTGGNVHMEDLVVGTKAMAWALQSDCKETLLDSCSFNQLSWPAMRALGVGFWLTDVGQLRIRMEKVARAQFLVEKDPKNCALLYLALQRKNVLLGLFKLSKDEKDRVLYEFLARDFQDEKNRVAALKNAFVLMGKHRHELAVAFFLLGGDLSSAVSVCAKNLGDLQLAFVICRLMEGIHGPIEHSLIKDYALPNTREAGDCWLASLFQWLLGERLQAIQALLGKFSISAITANSESVCRKNLVCQVSPERCELAYTDPDVGYYCLLLAAKPSVNLELTGACATALCKWIVSKTSTALKNLGLPMEALEYLNSSLNEKEACSNKALNTKEITVGSIYEPDLQSQDGKLCGSISALIGAETLMAVKMNLALQIQAHLVQSHPHWSFIEYFWHYSGSSTQGAGFASASVSDSTGVISRKLTVEANENLRQGFNMLETQFAINIKYILAELITLAYYQNRLYIQCLLTMEALDKVESTNQARQSTINSLPMIDYFLDKSAEEIPNFIIYPVLGCEAVSEPCRGSVLFKSDMQKLLSSDSDTSHCHRNGAILPDNVIEIMLLAFDLSYLLSYTTKQSKQVDAKVDGRRIYSDSVALLIFTLCCVSAWKGSQAHAIHRIASSILTCTSTLQSLVSDLEFFFGIILKSDCLSTSLEAHSKDSQICLGAANCGQLTEFEIWDILGVAFWETLFSWTKKQLGCKPSGGFQETSIIDSNLVSIEKAQRYKENILKSLACISCFFRRKLVSYVKLLFERSQVCPLSSWLWDSQLPAVSPASSSSTSASDANTASQIKRWAPLDTSNAIDAVWRLLVDRDRIRSALELEGFRCAEAKVSLPKSIGWFWRKNMEHSLESGPKADPSRAGFHGKDKLSQKVLPEQKVKGLTSNRSNRIMERSNTRAETSTNEFHYAEEVLHSSGDLFTAICVNSCCTQQIVVASNRKGLIYLDLNTRESFSSTEETLWSQAEWPSNGWAKSESTPVPTFVSPGVGLGSREGPGIGLGGATVGSGALPKVGKDFSLGSSGFGIPGYGGIGAMGMGWDDWEDFDGIIDPPATVENVSTKALDAHPLRPLFLVGSRNTHIYLWEFGKSSAVATYGILPASNIPPPYAVASVSAVRFDYSGHRFGTAAIDGTVCTWQLEVGGRSNVRPTESCLCFDQHASDVAFVGASGGILAATGCSQNNYNLMVWDTIAPPSTSRASLLCHEGGARCLEMFDHNVGGGSTSPMIVTGGKTGDIAIHDFRYIATGKAKRQRHVKRSTLTLHSSPQSNLKSPGDLRKQQDGEVNTNGMVWYIAKAHAGSISCISAVPGTSLFLTGSKDGDVKLWDVSKCELIHHWQKVHDRHMFLQHNVRSFGAVVQAAVTDIHPVSLGFLTCGGDGYLKLFRHQGLV